VWCTDTIEVMASSASTHSLLPDLAALSATNLLSALISSDDLAAHVARALAEDLGAVGDVTSQAMIAADARASAVVRFRSAGIACGAVLVEEVIRQAAPSTRVSRHADDGERLVEGAAFISLEGPLRGILAAERTLLNYVGHLSGIATLTATFVERTQGTRASICDTRKTLPGMRMLEKWAVRCGGGTNHRIGLFDAMLVKDNHVAGLTPANMAARVASAVAEARARTPLRFVEVECDHLEQLQAILDLSRGTVDMVLLDNMSAGQLTEAVRMRDAAACGLLLEASGGVNLDSVAAIAATGVDRISIGALTHSAPCLDIGLDIEQ
jgi:nicotinate-nucleotide pyrophosphorylase (carboxylating)